MEWDEEAPKSNPYYKKIELKIKSWYDLWPGQYQVWLS